MSKPPRRELPDNVDDTRSSLWSTVELWQSIEGPCVSCRGFGSRYELVPAMVSAGRALNENTR